MNSDLPRRDLLMRLGKLGLAVLTPIGTLAARPAMGEERTPSDTANVTPSIPLLTNLRTLSAPGQWENFSHELEPGCNVFHALDFDLDQSKIGPGVDLIVVADTITIHGTISNPGKNVTLVARCIISTPAREGLIYSSRVLCYG